MIMPSIPGEIADALVQIMESAPVQAELVAAIKAGEVPLQAFIDQAIQNAKGSGVLGIFIAATKGTVEAQVNAEFAQYTPEQIAAFVTKEAQYAAKALGG